MNDLEFREQYKRLTDVHPLFFKSKEKMDTVWQYVKDLDVAWFRKRCDSLVMAPDPRLERYDLGYAATAELRARRSHEFAEQVAQASQAWNEATREGLGNVLEKYGASNLFEAVQKSRKGDV